MMGVLGNVFRAVTSGVRRAVSAVARFARVAGKWLAKAARMVAAKVKVWARLAAAKIRAVAARMRGAFSNRSPRSGSPSASGAPARAPQRAPQRSSGSSRGTSSGTVCPSGHRVSAQQVPCGGCGGHERFECRMRMGIKSCGWSTVIPPMTRECND